MRSATYVTARPRYGFGDIVGLLFREFWVMLVVFLAVFILGAAAILTLKKTYTASASLFAGVGQEYVYQPRVGQSQDRGQAPNADQVAQSEAAILSSQVVKQRVVKALGPGVVLGDKPAAGTAAQQEAAAVKAIGDNLEVGATPGSAVINVSYESDDAARSARILNAVIDQYLIRRREVFQDRTSPAIGAQREVFQDDLAAADAAYQQFQTTNDIGDFAAAKTALAAAYQTAMTDKLSSELALAATDRRLRTLVAQQANTPAEIALQQDLNISAQDQILQLRTERENLLARYTPESQPVRDIEARIAGLQQYVATGTAVGAKEVRTGPNPIWVELETTRITTQAERDALRSRLAAAEQQLADIRERQIELTRQESENAVLAGNREMLQGSVREFQQREAQSRADGALVAAGADNVTVIERAQTPTRGKSLKAPLLAAVFLFAAFTALCVGLFRIFSRRGFATAGSAGRTLEMPVLAVAPAKAQ